jgi:hypothetical protein
MNTNSKKRILLSSSLALFYLATLGAEQEATQPQDSCTGTVAGSASAPPSSGTRKKGRNNNPSAFLNRGNKRIKYQ